MTPQSAIAALDRALAANGQKVTLRRTTGTQQVPFDVEVTAEISGYAPGDLVQGSGIIVGDSRAIISPTEMNERKWPAPPRVNDKVIVAGRTKNVQAVTPFYIMYTLVRIELQIRG